MPADLQRRALLAQALERRLEEAGGDTRAVPPALTQAADAEEQLRLVMVRLWPAYRKDPRAEARAALLAGVQALRDAALSDDLRFLDAWNTAWEALRGDGSGPTDDVARFAAAYAGLLEWHIEAMRR